MSRPTKDHYDAFDALAHPIRRQIVESLAKGERKAGDLGQGVDVTNAALSQHLQVLRRAGLVSDRRDGQRRIYKLNPAALRDVAKWVNRYAGTRKR